ncbi:dihydrodipicolinate synthase family protein [Jiangella asiatica]|uniref:Dihydrodipicolinate synthase family protein n=1 Tax=Jiangella asiatica TaxID=2530372 RepID=A0A4R5DPV8_9ACTN|nr:dihydrodipicolinate synthase family protein [Jiangella asiatica]TDE14244.1 dihydrodipicolinate synthase family protein [Jiangella asiatica]
MADGTALLGGVTVPLVTPMDATGRPAAEQARDLLGALAGAGVENLMLLGSNGEGPLLPTSVLGPFLEGVIEDWRSLTHGGVVTVNVTAPGTLDALDRAAIAASAGADALVMSPPIYFHHRDDEIVDHYAALAVTGLPVIAYNAPRYSIPITATVLDGLLELDHVVGIKDSSGDLEFLGHLVDRAQSCSGFAVSQGAETQLAAALDMGADGITPGVANLAPGLSLRLIAAHEAGDRDEVQRLQDQITALTKLHAIRPGTPAVKEILAQRSLCPPYVAPPLRRCTRAESADLRRFMSPHETQLLHPTKGQAAWSLP